MGKLGLTAEPTMYRIEYAKHQLDGLIEHGSVELAHSGFTFMLHDRLSDCGCLVLDLASAVAPCVDDTPEHGSQSGSAIRSVGREVSTPVKHLAFRSQERGQWPSALAR